MAKLINFLLFVLLILMGLYAFSLYADLPLDKTDLTINFKGTLPEALNTSSSLEQFAQNMRFNTSTLSYQIEDGCSEERVASMEDAFSMVTDETQVITFYDLGISSQEPDIFIKCSETSKETDSNRKNIKTFIAGEGGPTKFLNLTPYSLIIQGEIQLYSSRYQTKCAQPLVELHELLHVFGYNHIDDKTSVLYPYLSCDQEFKQNIIQDLKKLYSEPTKAELLIENISASKGGRYLSFYVEVKNTGLIDAQNVVLEVLADNRVVKDFDMESLSPGLTRSLNLTNLQLPSSRVTKISFKVKSSTQEYYLENNVVEMTVEG